MFKNEFLTVMNTFVKLITFFFKFPKEYFCFIPRACYKQWSEIWSWIEKLSSIYLKGKIVQWFLTRFLESISLEVILN